MALAKVKLTDLKSNQEFLLLVTKINQKGLLVQAATALPVGNLVSLAITLGDQSDKIELRGAVHKIVEKAGGGKGMIIRFLDLDSASLTRINTYLEYVQMDTVGDSEDYGSPPSANRTMAISVKDAEDLLADTTPPPEPKQKPRQEAKPKPTPPEKPKAKKRGKEIHLGYTVDEEAAQADHPSLAGETRMLQASEVEELLRGRPWLEWLKKLAIPFAVVLVGWAIFIFVTKIRERQNQPSESTIPTQIESTPIQATPEPRATATPRTDTDATPPAANPRSELKDVSVSEQSAFIKITFTTSGPVKAPSVSRLSDPKRLLVEFPDIEEVSADPLITVSKNPLLRVKVTKDPSGAKVVFDLYPVPFPRYDVKVIANTVNIYLFR